MLAVRQQSVEFKTGILIRSKKSYAIMTKFALLILEKGQY